MLSHTQIKFIKSLQQQKFRNIHKCFPVEGPKMIKELASSDFEITEIYATNEWEAIDTINSELLTIISQKELERISGQKNPKQVLAIAKIPEVVLSDKKEDIRLALDTISDPGNLGTIIRLADWFGLKNIYCHQNTVECFNPKVVQASMGSIFRIQVQYIDLSKWLNENKGTYQRLGADMHGENIYSADTETPVILTIGNEAHGIREDVQAELDKIISIPKYGKAESLNAGMATGIVLAEIFRKQHKQS